MFLVSRDGDGCFFIMQLTTVHCFRPPPDNSFSVSFAVYLENMAATRKECVCQASTVLAHPYTHVNNNSSFLPH